MARNRENEYRDDDRQNRWDEQYRRDESRGSQRPGEHARSFGGERWEDDERRGMSPSWQPYGEGFRDDDERREFGPGQFRQGQYGAGYGSGGDFRGRDQGRSGMHGSRQEYGQESRGQYSGGQQGYGSQGSGTQRGWQSGQQGRVGQSGSYGGWPIGESGNPWSSSMTRQGQHYGRGPKGYKRSDERVREDVNDALFRDGDIDASDIEVEVSEGEVTLNGTIDDRETKRMVEDCVWNVTGVKNVTNLLRVDKNRSRRGDGDDTGRGSDDQSRSKRSGAGTSTPKVGT